MPKVPKLALDDLFALVGPTLLARDASQFMNGLKIGFDGLYRRLIQGLDRTDGLHALETALSGSYGTFRQRQVLELCSWPIFDKPALPQGADAMPEFLWLYCLPFVVQFSQEDAQSPICFSGKVFDAAAIDAAVYQSGWLNPKAVLTSVPALVSREDLQREGPTSLATRFVKAELGLGPVELAPQGICLDQEVECARVATFYAIGAARLPVGERNLLMPAPAWEPAVFERLILAGLTEQGLAVESVISRPPCSMAETLLRCNPTGHLELHQVLTLAVKHYDLSSVTLQHPAEGWAELHAHLKGDPDPILLLPAFSFVEPCEALQACVQRCCDSLGLSFSGSFSVAGPTSSMLQ